MDSRTSLEGNFLTRPQLIANPVFHERCSEAREAVRDAMCAPEAMPRIVEEEA